MKKINIFLSLIAILFVVACNKDTIEPISLTGKVWTLKNVKLDVYNPDNTLRSSTTIPANDFTTFPNLKVIEFGSHYIYYALGEAEDGGEEVPVFTAITFLDSIPYTISGNRILVTPIDEETELFFGYYSLTSTTLSILNVDINQDGFGKSETTLNYTTPYR